MHVRMKIIIAMLGLSALSVTVLSAAPKPLPSDKALRGRFFAHRADFERLVTMATEDSHLTRIAPDFTWLDDDVGWPRKNVGISEQRWTVYRQIFRRVGASNGIFKSTEPTRISFPILSIGLVPTGFEKGIVHSEAPLSPALESLDDRPLHQRGTGPDGTHFIEYKQITEHWYIYYEQW
jgi:hypothetical protein